MTAETKQLSFGEVLALRPVRLLWIAQIVSIFGDFLALFAVLSDVSFRLKATPAQVTLISVAFLIPFALLGPVAGVFVDRWDAKRTMIASDLIRAALALGLAFASGLNQIYAILFALSAVSTFFVPAQTIAIRSVTPREGLMAANALMQQAFQVVRIISPAIAGAMVNWVGAKPAYYFDGASFIFSASMIAAIAIKRAAAATNSSSPSESGKLKSILNDLMAGARFIFTHATISFVMLAMAAGMFALSCFAPLIAIYVRDMLKSTGFQFGVISSMIGVGMIFATQFITRFAKNRSKSLLVVAGLFGMGVAVMVMVSIGHVAVAAVGAFGIGFGAIFIIVPTQTLMQQETPVELVGRVSSSFMSVLSVSQLLGLIISGSLTQRMGIRNLFFASAAMLVLFALFGFFRLPKQAPVAAQAVR
ncbi:MAG TPA: MFS transporter [Blastocatellia bacterium]|nr:MFS transporter [Blastocatellia bacterium]